MDIDTYQPEAPFIPEPTPETDTPSPVVYPPSLKDLFLYRKMEWANPTGFHGGPTGRRKGYKLALWSFTASMIDLCMLLGFSCVFLLVFLKIVKMPITQNLLQDFLVVFILGSWMYMTATRFFMGSSLGEAACDIRLGKPQEASSSKYFAKVLIRTTLIVCTGIFVLPLLSLLCGRDIAGSLSGIKLFSLV